MKKLLVILIATMLCASPALAFETWYWDTSGTSREALGATVGPTFNDSNNGVNWDTTVWFPTDVTTSGASYINQFFTGGDPTKDDILDAGDTFADFGLLTVISAGNATTNTESSINWRYDTGGGVYQASSAYIVYTGLEGYISSYDDGGTPTSDASGILDDSFTLTFTPGKGDIGVYLDTNTNPDDGLGLQVADLDLVSGTGTSPFPVEGFNEGQFGLTAKFVSVLDNFWYFGDGSEFGQETPLDLILAQSFNLGATQSGIPFDITDPADGIRIDVINEGSFVVNVVPEPSTFFLLGAGLVGLGFIARRRKQQ